MLDKGLQMLRLVKTMLMSPIVLNCFTFQIFHICSHEAREDVELIKSEIGQNTLYRVTRLKGIRKKIRNKESYTVYFRLQTW
jgi:hypothetical protein